MEPRRKAREESDPEGSGDERNAASGSSGLAQPGPVSPNSF
jgi:hypothetical protein